MTIKQKQWQLWYLGCYAGNIDGIWGSLSRQATKDYQSQNGLEADGSFGPATEADSRQLITDIQKLLGVTADGLAGPQTQAATVRWQAQAGLPADGIAGAATRQAMAQSPGWWQDVRHFTAGEFACKCGCGWPSLPRRSLLELCDRVREGFGAAATVSSGLRCESHNRAVGGVARSRHKAGKAVDFSVAGKTAAQVLACVKQQPQVRYCYAIDSRYVHMDIV